MKVEDVMMREVHCVAPEASLKDVAAVLVEHAISGMPVCDGDGRVLGIVSEADILYKERGPRPRRGGPLAWLVDGAGYAEVAKSAARTAGKAMTRPAVTIDPDRPVSEAARLMLERRVNRLPVVKADQLLGIVTRADLVRAFTRTDAEIEHEIRDEVLDRVLLLPPGAVSVVVTEGQVRLGGLVERRSDAELLPGFVARVPGVVAVDSDVKWRLDDVSRKGQRALASTL
ncbi:MAG TPA: CBS domain-containing protein [Gaiellaceae bacterium]